jgi:hypothetical protein
MKSTNKKATAPESLLIYETLAQIGFPRIVTGLQLRLRLAWSVVDLRRRFNSALVARRLSCISLLGLDR